METGREVAISYTISKDVAAPRGNPILVPLDVSRRGHRRSCIEKGDWVAYPVDLQGKRLLGMAWPELQRLCIDPTGTTALTRATLPWKAG